MRPLTFPTNRNGDVAYETAGLHQKQWRQRLLLKATVTQQSYTNKQTVAKAAT